MKIYKNATGMGDGMEAACAVVDEDRDMFGRGRFRMDSKFTGTDGDGDKCTSPCSSVSHS